MTQRAFVDQSKYWVIFDTCPRPEYYLDVHNILAAPPGWVLRYEYRDKYVAPAALQVMNADDDLPDRILFGYTQPLTYARGGGALKETPGFDAMMWVPTRLGRMLNIVERAGQFFFDFEVLGYPMPGVAATDIFRSLYGAHETPFWKWVTFLNRLGEFEALSTGSSDDNWEAIVEQLDRPPSQFAGDVFWRLLGLKRSRHSEVIAPKQLVEAQAQETRQVKAYYPVRDALNYSIEITTKRSPEKRGGGPPLPYVIQGESDDRDIMRVVGDGRIDARQYTSAHLELETKGLTWPKPRVVELSLVTEPKDGDWSQGPQTRLRVEVTKRPVSILLALVALALGGLIGSSAGWTTPLGVIASGLLTILGATLWTGKFTK